MVHEFNSTKRLRRFSFHFVPRELCIGDSGLGRFGVVHRGYEMPKPQLARFTTQVNRAHLKGVGMYDDDVFADVDIVIALLLHKSLEFPNRRIAKYPTKRAGIVDQDHMIFYGMRKHHGKFLFNYSVFRWASGIAATRVCIEVDDCGFVNLLQEWKEAARRCLREEPSRL